MKKPRFLPRILALFLTLVLALPNPSFALRQLEPTEAPQRLNQIRVGLEEEWSDQLENLLEIVAEEKIQWNKGARNTVPESLREIQINMRQARLDYRKIKPVILPGWVRKPKQKGQTDLFQFRLELILYVLESILQLDEERQPLTLDNILSRFQEVSREFLLHEDPEMLATVRWTEGVDQDVERISSQILNAFHIPAAGLEESVMEPDIRNAVSDLWAAWDPSKTLLDQPPVFNQTRDSLRAIGFNLAHVRVYGGFRKLRIDPTEGSDRGPAQWLEWPDLPIRLSLRALLENISQHVPSHEGLVLLRTQKEQQELLVVDRGNGVPEDAATQKPNLVGAIQDGVSLSPTGSLGGGLTAAVKSANKGAEIWTNGHGLVIPSGKIEAAKEIPVPTSARPISGFLVYVQVGDSFVAELEKNPQQWQRLLAGLEQAPAGLEEEWRTKLDRVHEFVYLLEEVGGLTRRGEERAALLRLLETGRDSLEPKMLQLYRKDWRDFVYVLTGHQVTPELMEAWLLDQKKDPAWDSELAPRIVAATTVMSRFKVAPVPSDEKAFVSAFEAAMAPSRRAETSDFIHQAQSYVPGIVRRVAEVIGYPHQIIRSPEESGLEEGDILREERLRAGLEQSAGGVIVLHNGEITFAVDGGGEQAVLPDEAVRAVAADGGVGVRFLVDLTQERRWTGRLLDRVGIPASALPNGIECVRLTQMTEQEIQAAFVRVNPGDVLFIDETESVDRIPAQAREKLTIVRISAWTAETLTLQKVEALIRAAERAAGRDLNARGVTLTGLEEAGGYSLAVVTGT